MFFRLSPLWCLMSCSCMQQTKFQKDINWVNQEKLIRTEGHSKFITGGGQERFLGNILLCFLTLLWSINLNIKVCVKSPITNNELMCFMISLCCKYLHVILLSLGLKCAKTPLLPRIYLFQWEICLVQNCKFSIPPSNLVYLLSESCMLKKENNNWMVDWERSIPLSHK